MKNQFTVDFFELCFLAEACIPPRPIARSMFWQRLINDIYYDLSKDQREQMFQWMIRHASFNTLNEDCQWFYARFNPKNQFLVMCNFNNEDQQIEAFKKDDKYWTSMTKYISNDYIKNIARL